MLCMTCEANHTQESDYAGFLFIVLKPNQSEFFNGCYNFSVAPSPSGFS